VDGGGIAGGHDVLGVDDTSHDDAAVEARAVEKRLENLLSGQLLEIAARHVQAPAKEHALPDAEVASYEVVHRRTARRQVTAVLRRSERDAVVARQRVEGLGFDQ